MPYKNIEEQRTYQAQWARVRYTERRIKAVEYLGGKCIDCGSLENLEFDHRVPADKSFVICRRLATGSWDTIKAELDKCDLRCYACHGHMTAYQKLQSTNVLGAIV